MVVKICLPPPAGSKGDLSADDQFRYCCAKKLELVCNMTRDFGKRGDGMIALADLEDVCRAAGVAMDRSLLERCWRKLKQLPNGRVPVWDALMFLAPPRAGRAAHKILDKVENIKAAQRRAAENKSYKRAAILQRTEGMLWRDLDTLPLNSNVDDSALLMRERELENNVRTATTSEMRQAAKCLLERFRQMSLVGHTPTPTPRGSRFMVIDYERPKSSETNCIIDLLPPDNHQIWRGTLPREQMRIFMDKYRRGKHKMQAIENRFLNAQNRAETLAFSFAPFRPEKAPVLSKSGSDAPADVSTSALLHGKTIGDVAAERPKTCATAWAAARPGTGAQRPGTGFSEARASRPGTGMSGAGRARSRGIRPGSSALPGRVAADALLALWERLVAMGRGDWASALHDMSMAGAAEQGAGERVLDRARVEEAVGEEAAREVWQLLDAQGRGWLSLADTEAAFRFLLDDGAGEPRARLGTAGAEWFHPTSGHLELSPVQADLLAALKQRLARRWRRGVSESFQALDELLPGGEGQTAGRAVLRALLSAVSLSPSDKELAQLWAALDPAGLGSVPWSTVRAALEIPAEPLEPLEDSPRGLRAPTRARRGGTAGPDGRTAHPAPDAAHALSRRVGRVEVRLRRRSRSAPPEAADDAALLRELLRSSYETSFGGSPDFRARHGPLGRKAARGGALVAPSEARLRPLSTASSALSALSAPSDASPTGALGRSPARKSVRFLGDAAGGATPPAGDEPQGRLALTPPDMSAGMCTPFVCGPNSDINMTFSRFMRLMKPPTPPPAAASRGLSPAAAPVPAARDKGGSAGGVEVGRALGGVERARLEAVRALFPSGLGKGGGGVGVLAAGEASPASAGALSRAPTRG